MKLLEENYWNGQEFDWCTFIEQLCWEEKSVVSVSTCTSVGDLESHNPHWVTQRVIVFTAFLVSQLAMIEEHETCSPLQVSSSAQSGNRGNFIKCISYILLVLLVLTWVWGSSSWTVWTRIPESLCAEWACLPGTRPVPQSCTQQSRTRPGWTLVLSRSASQITTHCSLASPYTSTQYTINGAINRLNFCDHF